MSRLRALSALLAVVAAFAVAGCGDDDETPAQPAGATATPTPDEQPRGY